MQPVDSLYICPWSLSDPLCESQTLTYLRGLTARNLKFALITIENPRYALDSETAARRTRELEAENIFWFPIEYHAGLSLKAKAIDNFNGVKTGIKIWRKHRPRAVHSRSSLTAAMALVIAKICRLKFLYDADSQLSEEYVDVGHWSRQSNGFRIMSKTEDLARRAATEIVVLSETLRQDFINNYNVKAPITVIPCCVDVEKYKFSGEARARRRAEIAVGDDEKLLIYVGKIGGRYLVENAFEFFKAASERIANLKLLVVSHEPAERFEEIAAKTNVARAQFFVRRAASAEVAEWLSAADAGLAIIKSSPSERGASPIKIAEYLAAGLPIVLTDNIGDCSRLIAEKNAGAILKQVDSRNYEIAAAALERLFAEDREIVAQRCCATAIENFALDAVGVRRYAEIYRRLL